MASSGCALDGPMVVAPGQVRIRTGIEKLAHDLRTPLAAIRGQIEEAILFENESRQDAALSSIQSAEKQAEYLQKLVDRH